jgi:integrase
MVTRYAYEHTDSVVSNNIIEIFGGYNGKKKVVKERYSIETGSTPVQPIRSKEHIELAKQYFLNKPERYKGQNIRDYVIFVMGINIARRCGDLLHIRVHNILNSDMSFKSHISINEQKTGKSACIIITPVIQDALRLYLTSIGKVDLSDPLFPSRNKNKDGSYKAMTVKNLYAKMKALESELGLEKGTLGTHSLRKTFGYHAATNKGSTAETLATLTDMYNHSNPKITQAYLSLNQDNKDGVSMNNQL